MTALLVGMGMVVGLGGVLLPILPGLPLMWVCALIYGIASGFSTAGTIIFVVITALVILGEVLQYVLPGKAASGAGAAKTSILLGVLLAIVGFFAIPVIGLPLGGVAGVLLGEYLRTNDLSAAQDATWATIKGFGIGVLAQLVCALAVLLAWFVWVLL